MPDDKVVIKHTVEGVSSDADPKQIEANVEYHPWKIFIDGTPEALSKIRKVVYKFNDKSFSNQEVETQNRESKFSTEVFGFKNLNIICIIYPADPKKNPITYKYDLTIGKSNENGSEVQIG